MTFTTDRPIVLPPTPFPGQSVEVDLIPEELKIRFTWEGNGIDDSTDYWRVIGDFSWGNKFDDLYVSKTGDKMSGYLINLNKELDDYDENEPLNPLIDPRTDDFVSLVAQFERSGLTLYGSYGIEDNKELPKVSEDVIIRNEAVIGGSVTSGGLVKVIKDPFIEGGEPGKPVNYTYRWQRCNDRRYWEILPRGRDFTIVAKAEIYFRGTPNPALREYETTGSAEGTGCKINIDQIDENGLVSDISVSENGSGYKSGEILTLDGTDVEVIVTDIVQLNSFEEQPPAGDACWNINDDIDPENKDYHILTDDDIGGYIRCEVTCTIGGVEPGTSYSNPIGIIS